MKKKSWRTLSTVAMTTWVLAWGAMFYLEGVYLHYPVKPDYETGRIVKYSLKSITVYVTKLEMAEIDCIHIVGIGSLAFGFICAGIAERKDKQ